MKITFIRPDIGKRKGYKNFGVLALEPLAIAVLVGLTPKDIEIAFYDERIENIPYNEPTDLVAISVETLTAKRAYEISQEFRKRGVKVVIGGVHPTLMPKEAIGYVDAIVIGEAENIWKKVIEDFRKGKMKKFYKSKKRHSLEGIKPRRNIFKRKKYLPVNIVEFGRGCNLRCDFCSVNSFFKGQYLHRPIEEVINEIRKLEKKIIIFSDDNIIANINSAKKLFKALIPLKIKWVGHADISITKDDELLDLAAKSGCKCLSIGFESLKKDNLKQMNKITNIEIDYEAAIKKLKSKKIRIYGSFVLGYDYDDKILIRQTIKFAIKHKFFIANFFYLRPIPGTPLYDKLKKEDRLINDKWWLDENNFFDVTFKPKNMSTKQLEKECDNATSKFYSLTSTIKRSFDFKTNCNSLPSIILFYVANFFLKFRTCILRKNYLETA